MPNFDTYSNYKADSSFSSVVFGGESALLETELQEMQQIASEKHTRLASAIGGKVIIPLNLTESLTFASGVLTMKECNVLAGPYTFYIESTNISGTGGQVAYLEVTEETVTYQSSLKKYGNTAGASVSNNVMDPRLNVETSRRKVVKYTLKKASTLPSDTLTTFYVKVGSFSSDNSTFTFNKDIIKVSADNLTEVALKGTGVYKFSGKVESLEVNDWKLGGFTLINSIKDNTFSNGISKNPWYRGYKSDTFLSITKKKNLLPSFTANQVKNGVSLTVNEEKAITLSGYATADTYFYLDNTTQSTTEILMNLSKQTTYFLSTGLSEDIDVEVALFNKSTVVFNVVTTDSFTPEDLQPITGYYVFIPQGKTLTNVTLKLQLEEGLIATRYQPYYEKLTVNRIIGATTVSRPNTSAEVSPDNVQTFTDASNFVVKSNGENLFNVAISEPGELNQTTGLPANSPTVWRTGDYIKVKPNTSYILSGVTEPVRYFEYTSSKTFVLSKVVTSGAYITGETTEYIKFQKGTSAFPSTSRFELGSTATEDSFSYTGTLGALTEGSSIVNIIEYNADTGVTELVERWKKYALTANDILNGLDTTSSTSVDYINIKYTNMVGVLVPSTNDLVATSIVTDKSAPRNNASGTGIINKHWKGVTYLSIAFAKGKYADITAAKAAYVGTVIRYELATPIVTTLSIKPVLKIYNGVTNLFASSSPQVTVSGITPLSIYPKTGNTFLDLDACSNSVYQYLENTSVNDQIFYYAQVSNEDQVSVGLLNSVTASESIKVSPSGVDVELYSKYTLTTKDTHVFFIRREVGSVTGIKISKVVVLNLTQLNLTSYTEEELVNIVRNLRTDGNQLISFRPKDIQVAPPYLLGDFSQVDGTSYVMSSATPSTIMFQTRLKKGNTYTYDLNVTKNVSGGGGVAIYVTTEPPVIPNGWDDVGMKDLNGYVASYTDLVGITSGTLTPTKDVYFTVLYGCSTPCTIKVNRFALVEKGFSNSMLGGYDVSKLHFNESSDYDSILKLNRVSEGCYDYITADGILVKNVGEYILTEANISALVTATTTYVDYITLNYTGMSDIYLPSSYDNYSYDMITNKTSPRGGLSAHDTVSAINKHGKSSDYFFIYVAKDKFADLASAKAYYAGTKVYYKLASPKVYDLKKLGLMSGSIQSIPNGVLASLPMSTGLDGKFNFIVPEQVTPETKAVETSKTFRNVFSQIRNNLAILSAHMLQKASNNILGHVLLSDVYSISMGNASAGLGASQYALYSAVREMLTTMYNVEALEFTTVTATTKVTLNVRGYRMLNVCVFTGILTTTDAIPANLGNYVFKISVKPINLFDITAEEVNANTSIIKGGYIDTSGNVYLQITGSLGTGTQIRCHGVYMTNVTP